MKNSAVKFYHHDCHLFQFTWKKEDRRPENFGGIESGCGLIYKYRADVHVNGVHHTESFRTLNEAKAYIRSLLEA